MKPSPTWPSKYPERMPWPESPSGEEESACLRQFDDPLTGIVAIAASVGVRPRYGVAKRGLDEVTGRCVVGSESEQFERPAVVGGKRTPPGERRIVAKKVGDEVGVELVLPQHCLAHDPEHVRVGLRRKRRRRIERAENRDGRERPILQIEPDVLPFADERVDGSVEPDDVALETMPKTRLGDAAARFEVVNEVPHVGEFVGFEFDDVCGHHAAEKDGTPPGQGLGRERLKAERDTSGRGDRPRVSDLALGQKHSLNATGAPLLLGRATVLLPESSSTGNFAATILR